MSRPDREPSENKSDVRPLQDQNDYLTAVNRTLFDITSAVNAATTLDELYQSIHTILSRVIDVDYRPGAPPG
jgi:hypothetical protein